MKTAVEIADARASRALPENWQDDVINQLQQLDELARNQKRRVIGEKVTLPAHDPEFTKVMLAIPGATEFFTKLAKSQTKDGMEGEIQLTETINRLVKEMVPLKLERNFTLSSEQRTELSALTNSPQAYKQRSPITKAMLEQFREYRALHNISAKNIDTQEARLKALSNYLRTQGKQLTFDSVAEFVKTIDRSPATQQQFVLAGAYFGPP